MKHLCFSGSLEKTKKMETKIQEQLDVLVSLLAEYLSTDTRASITEWIPLQKCREFLAYGETQMATLLKSENLVVSQIGRRKFISRESLLELLENNII
jgi:hypothetical protein